MKSRLTEGNTSLLFTGRILNKYNVRYYLCKETGFIQTENPFWLDEAYQSVITKLDVGLVHRNIHLSNLTETLLIKFFDYKSIFLDYAGGYGLFTRIMRDKGFNFYSTDKYCTNIFAAYFDLCSFTDNPFFEMVTAFEVLEHLIDPIGEIEQILRFSDNLLFTTELWMDEPERIKDWHYLSPETGQHISFYNIRSLKYLAQHFGCCFYSDGVFIHLFTKKPLPHNPFIKSRRDPFLLRKAKKYIKKVEKKNEVKLDSLIAHDWELIKRMLNS